MGGERTAASKGYVLDGFRSLEPFWQNTFWFYCDRSEAIECGLQMEVSPLSARVGIEHRVFITRQVFELFMEKASKKVGRRAQARILRILRRLKVRMHRGDTESPRLIFEVWTHGSKMVRLVALAGCVDLNDNSPATTIISELEDDPITSNGLR
jgi:hypothetical protein